jgi:glycogen debranching enzyme
MTKAQPFPLGLTLRDGGANIAVHSHTATHIELVLFDSDGKMIWQQTLTHHSGDVHFAFVEGMGEGQHYGLRAHGPYDPAAGLHFDPHKLLLDPYAKAISRPFSYSADLSRHGAETAFRVPKAVAMADFPPLPLRKPHAPKLIYEVNVRGFTKLHPDVPEAKRGTIAALAEPAIIQHLKKIGADTIELLPIAAWIDERHLANLGLTNAWGYNPVSLFAIDPRLAPGGLLELRETVSTLHEAGINVVLDVVFNHTGESDMLGPTLSLRGLDCTGYYRLFHGTNINDAGTGNTLALDRPHTVRWVVDSMRHWVLNCGVDGFRFDLASIMGREEKGFNREAPLLQAIESDPVLSSRILIAEPWDLGPGGYQLGNFPQNWFEWNDLFRDDVRRFWRGDPWSTNNFATRLAGSADRLSEKGRPSRSINFIAAHDGFTLHDVLHFTQKNNFANGENNRDGKDNEVTCPGSRALALLSSLLFARGTPMITAGDEFGRTQGGNNNAYAQDNRTTWLDWENRNVKLEQQFSTLVELRQSLSDVINDGFLSGTKSQGNSPDVEWLAVDGTPLDWSQDTNRSFVMVLASAKRRICILFNGASTGVDLTLVAASGKYWRNLTGDELRAPAQAVMVFEEVSTNENSKT